jgi:hypothetical protein
MTSTWGGLSDLSAVASAKAEAKPAANAKSLMGFGALNPSYERCKAFSSGGSLAAWIRLVPAMRFRTNYHWKLWF